MGLVMIGSVPQWVQPWLAARKGLGATQAAAPLLRQVDLKVNTGRGLAARSIANLTRLAAGTPFSEAEADRLFSALSMLDAATDGASWYGIGAALHDLKWIVNGVDEGFEIWDEWSSTSKGQGSGNGEYKGRGDLEKRWASFGKEYHGSRRTVSSIYKAALDLGWSYEPKQENINGHDSLASFAPSFTQSKPSNPLIELNDKYCTIGDLGGKCLVMSWVPSKAEAGVKVPSFQSFKAFHERFSNRYVQIEDKMKPLGSHWTGWPHRRSFDGIDLVPGAEPVLPGNVMNLWRGFAIEPSPGDWHLMREHIAYVLAGGDRASAEYILRFAAWAVQNPGERAEVALVFRGGKGSGKGTFANAMRQIFGAHGLQVFSAKHLIGSFNGHLRACLLLFADEAFWAGDKQGESVLKGMLTEPTLMIEQKGIDATPWKNRLHVVMAANAEWVVPASHDERRYATFDVVDTRIGDRAYFKALHDELQRGGLAAMLHDLLRLDLGEWHPRQIIYTEALQKQKARSLSTIAEWWEQILQTGTLPFFMKDGKASNEVTSTALVNMLREFAPKSLDCNPTRIGRFVRTMGAKGMHHMNGNAWKMLNLTDHRAKWEAMFGKWNWEHDLKTWNQPDNHS